MEDYSSGLGEHCRYPATQKKLHTRPMFRILKIVSVIVCMSLVCGVFSNQFEPRSFKEEGETWINGWPLISTHCYIQPSRFDFEGNFWLESLKWNRGEFLVEHNALSLGFNFLVIACLSIGSIVGLMCACRVFPKGANKPAVAISVLFGLLALYCLFNFESAIIRWIFSVFGVTVDARDSFDIVSLGPIWDRLWYHQYAVLVAAFLTVFGFTNLALAKLQKIAGWGLVKNAG